MSEREGRGRESEREKEKGDKGHIKEFNKNRRIKNKDTHVVERDRKRKPIKL